MQGNLDANPKLSHAESGIVPPRWAATRRTISDYEILYVRRGKLKVQWEHGIYEGRSGDIFFFTPEMRQLSIEAADRLPVEREVVRFELPPRTFEAFAANGKDEFAEGLRIPPLVRTERHEAFGKKLCAVVHEFAARPPLFELQASALLTELLVWLCRSTDRPGFDRGGSGAAIGGVTAEGYAEGEAETDADGHLGKVQQYLLQHVRGKVSLDELASMSNVSKFHLIHQFKKKYGLSPIQYHQKARIGKARELIRSTNQSLSEIADALGFESIHSFSRTFKKVDGLPPSFYRN